MSKFELKKVFNCHDMPDELCSQFLRSWDNKSNDCYVSWNVGEMSDEDVDAWLMQNGAEDGEEVIISYWW